VDNFFFGLYKKLVKMGMDGRDLDHMLAALNWQEKERKSDGTIIYECKIEK